MKHVLYSWTMLPDRRRPSHPDVVQSWDHPPIVFITVCTHGRKPILARPEVLTALRAAWSDSSDWFVGRFVIMPDHIHLFCGPSRSDSSPVRNWVRYWKSLATRRWPWPEERPVWQSDFWDRQLRNDESYSQKWEYVRLNPVRHNHVTHPEDWPYQGELHELRWH